MWCKCVPLKLSCCQSVRGLVPVTVGAGDKVQMIGLLDNNLSLLNVNDTFLHDEYFFNDGEAFVNYSLYLHHSPDSWDCRDGVKQKILLNKITQVMKVESYSIPF